MLKRMFGKGKSRRKPANAGSSGRMAVCDGRVITNKHVYSVRTLVRGNSAKVVHDAAKFVQLGIEVFDKLEQTNSKHMTHNFTKGCYITRKWNSWELKLTITQSCHTDRNTDSRDLNICSTG